MSQHPRIVLGLDDVRGPELDWAAREAESRQLPLQLLRAYHMIPDPMPFDRAIDRMIVADLKRRAEHILQDALAHLGRCWPEVKTVGTLVEGDPVRVLGEASGQAELTVLGSRQYGLFNSIMTGSVSTVVAATGRGPVVVVAHTPASAAEHPAVVVGIHGGESTTAVLAFAFDFASRHHRRLAAVFCWRPDPLATGQWRPSPPAPEHAERWLAEAIAGWQQKYPDVPVQRAVVRDHPVTGLVATSTAQELLVVGSHSTHPRIATLLGSVSQGVLHRATCPVAVIHPRAS
jgi:nucleotide-binding universal stress UspA family protein